MGRIRCGGLLLRMSDSDLISWSYSTEAGILGGGLGARGLGRGAGLRRFDASGVAGEGVSVGFGGGVERKRGRRGVRGVRRSGRRSAGRKRGRIVAGCGVVWWGDAEVG